MQAAQPSLKRQSFSTVGEIRDVEVSEGVRWCDLEGLLCWVQQVGAGLFQCGAAVQRQYLLTVDCAE
jgi:hypothetical protein